MNDLEWLQAVYIAEKKIFIDIDTCDNPAWSIKIHLTDTNMDGAEFTKVKIDNSEADWYVCFVRDNVFIGVASPNNFGIVLTILRKWWRDFGGIRTSEMSDLDWLRLWYYSYCDEDWEHDKRVIIRSSTADMPAWIMEVNFEGTSLEDKPFDPIDFKEQGSWIRCFVDEDEFKANCSPDQLVEVVRIFRHWAENIRTQGLDFRENIQWETIKRYDSDYIKNKPHWNKITRQDVGTPHVHDPEAPSKIRKPHDWEIPK